MVILVSDEINTLYIHKIELEESSQKINVGEIMNGNCAM